MMNQNQASRIDTWEPVVGNGIKTFISMIDFLRNDDDRQNEVINQAKRILSRCANPAKQVDQKCTLVLGQVQSGKTLSFTSVIALSRDNQIPLTILLGGTKRLLMQQTFERLEKDLLADSQGSARKWLIKRDAKSTDKNELLEALESYYDTNVPLDYRQSVVLVVMKNRTGINKAKSIVQALQKSLSSQFPVLIIDDEGDQASPNTKQEREEKSATYAAIWDLRDSLPNHSFLSYTATPEANLLLEIGDILSPDSVVVLSPGDEYLGGYELFSDRSSRFIQLIPETELEVATNPNATESPPKSLQSALAYFFVVLSVAQKHYPQVRPVSMLIHPDSKIDSHNQYRKWVSSIIDRWRVHFDEMDELGEIDKQLPRDFVSAILELRRTVEIDSLFEDNADLEIVRLLKYWLRSNAIEIRVVNSERASNTVSPEEWRNRAGWILIGAGKLDRGFVVEKLVATYMPRGRGGGNVDTIQQRGRFFGYKKGYQELLRGWMSEDLVNAYKNIVETETELRIDLKKFDDEGFRLQDWRRNMVLAHGLAPTRSSVISMDYSILNLRDNSWFKQHRLFDPILQSMQSQLEPRISSLLSSAEVSNLDNRTNTKRHLRKIVDLPSLLELLIDWPMIGEDRVLFDKHLLLLSKYSRNHRQTHASVFFMNQLEVRERSAENSSSGSMKYWSINNLHEGRSSSSNGTYVGDAAIKNSDSITIQIHKVAPRAHRNSVAQAPIYALALAWPNGFNKRVLEQL